MSEILFDQKEITVPAVLLQMTVINGFIGRYLDELNCSEKARFHIRIAVDEIFSNIVRHSNARNGDTITVLVHAVEEPRSVVITFRDRSPGFDPLSAEEPDVTVSARKRKIGGLGLFMVKKIMDKVIYEYRNEQNILTIKKTL